MSAPYRAIFLSGLCLNLSCTTKEFGSQSPSGQKDAILSQDLLIPCNVGSAGVNPGPIYVPPKGLRLQIKGQFCFTQTASSNEQPQYIHFLVDTSGSMKKIDQEVPGASGAPTCKRLIAAEALMNAMSERSPETQNTLRFTLMHFGDQATWSTQTPLTLKEFKQNYLNSKILCQSKDNALTNYEAAFSLTNQFLKTLPAEAAKLTYMFTDGMPSANLRGQCRDLDCQANALQAAAGLKAYNLSYLSIMFLMDPQDPENLGPGSFLQKLASSPEAVRFVNDAEEAAQAIKDFIILTNPKIPRVANVVLKGPAGEVMPGLDWNPTEAKKTQDFKIDEIFLKGEDARYELRIRFTKEGKDTGENVMLNFETILKPEAS